MTIISTTDRRVGQVLARARRTAGWSHERLAPAIGLSPSDLAQAEAGRRRLQTADLFSASAAMRTAAGPLLAMISPPTIARRLDAPTGERRPGASAWR